MSNRLKVSFDIDNDQRAGMKELTSSQGISFADGCRRAVRDYLERNGIDTNKRPDVHERQTVIPGCEE